MLFEGAGAVTPVNPDSPCLGSAQGRLLREVFDDTVGYGADPAGLATALDAALRGRSPDPAAGRDLARSHRWDDVAAAHLRLYAELPPR